MSDIRSVLGGVLASGNATVVTKLNHEISANRTKVNSAHTGKSLRFVDWMGQLLLSRASQQGLSSGGKARLQEAASVVVCQAQRGVARDQEVSGGILARRAGSSLHHQADAQSPVGVIVSLSPRAGSGKSAHPV